MTGGWTAPRRFWSSVGIVEAPGGWGLTLDGKPVRTPARALLQAPTRALAEACAAEWDAQGERLDPGSMPVTRSLNAAIDRVAPHREAVVEQVAAYGESDLLCYRAEGPEALVEREAAAWDPWLDWARRRLGAPLLRVAGVMHARQPAESVARLRAAVAERDTFRLTALHELTALSGSLVLGLAVEEGALDAPSAWTISRTDEIWQAEQWGEDAEAAAEATRKGEAFAQAARFARLARD